MRSFFTLIKKNPYRLFAAKIIALLLIVFVLDFSIGSLLNYLYFKQSSGNLMRTTYSVEQTNEDILIFGSSRARHSYVTEVFEKRLNMSYCNVGEGGQSIFYHYALLKATLKRYSPKMIILDIKDLELQVIPSDYDKISALLPYYSTHPEIHSIVDLKSKFEKYKMYSKIYPFNSLAFKIVSSNLESNKKIPEFHIKGYAPLKGSWQGKIKIDTNSVYELDYNKINCLSNFIKDCKKAKVKLYLSAAPYIMKSNGVDYSILKCQKIAEKNHVKFYDYSRHQDFISDRSLFADWVHLNDTGARLFTNALIDKIQNEK